MPIVRTTKNKETGYYTKLNNSGCRNVCLPPEVAGILWRLLSLPDSWNFTVSWLMKEYGYASAKAASIKKTLEDFGYLFMPEGSKVSLGRAKGFAYTRILYENPCDNPYGFKYKNAYLEHGKLKPAFINWYKARYNVQGKPLKNDVTKHTTEDTTWDVDRPSELQPSKIEASIIEDNVTTEEIQSSENKDCKEVITEEVTQPPLEGATSLPQIRKKCALEYIRAQDRDYHGVVVPIAGYAIEWGLIRYELQVMLNSDYSDVEYTPIKYGESPDVTDIWFSSAKSNIKDISVFIDGVNLITALKLQADLCA